MCAWLRDWINRIESIESINSYQIKSNANINYVLNVFSYVLYVSNKCNFKLTKWNRLTEHLSEKMPFVLAQFCHFFFCFVHHCITSLFSILSCHLRVCIYRNEMNCMLCLRFKKLLMCVAEWIHKFLVSLLVNICAFIIHARMTK